MGWGHCGTDDNGREIGYVIEATCDHGSCEAKIDRGLSYVCGVMHGGSEIYLSNGDFFTTCGGYFCSKHAVYVNGTQVCKGCEAEFGKCQSEIEKCQQIQ